MMRCIFFNALALAIVLMFANSVDWSTSASVPIGMAISFLALWVIGYFMSLRGHRS